MANKIKKEKHQAANKYTLFTLYLSHKHVKRTQRTFTQKCVLGGFVRIYLLRPLLLCDDAHTNTIYYITKIYTIHRIYIFVGGSVLINSINMARA